MHWVYLPPPQTTLSQMFSFFPSSSATSHASHLPLCRSLYILGIVALCDISQEFSLLSLSFLSLFMVGLVGLREKTWFLYSHFHSFFSLGVLSFMFIQKRHSSFWYEKVKIIVGYEVQRLQLQNLPNRLTKGMKEK